MGWKATLRAIEAAERRTQRDALKRQRDLERRNKEQAKLTAIEQNKLEVETFENQLEVLLTVHKSCGEPWDWIALMAALPPLPPVQNFHHQIKAKQMALVCHPLQRPSAEAAIAQAQSHDEQAFQIALTAHAAEMAEWEELKLLAARVLKGEHKAYIEALVDFSPLGELTTLGSLLHFTVENAKLIACDITVNGTQAIPQNIKTLTATEKLSVKAMPRARFHEIYQDYICGCMLRVAREVFVIIPVETLLITASAEIADSVTGRASKQPVVSAVMPRAVVESLNFDALDPTDAMENFLHRSNFKATRKAGAFQPVVPLTAADAVKQSVRDLDHAELLSAVRNMREDLTRQIREFQTTAARNLGGPL